MKGFFLNTSQLEEKQFRDYQKSDKMENFALGQQISDGLSPLGTKLEEICGSYCFSLQKNLEHSLIGSNTNPF